MTSQNWAEAVDSVCREWMDTPYVPGQKEKGCGVDCIQFLSGVMEEVTGKAVDVPRLPPHVALHSLRSAVSTVHTLTKGFGFRRHRGSLESGDVIVFRISMNRSSNLGHCGIVALDSRLVYHAFPRVGVVLTGIYDHTPVVAAYRIKEYSIV